MYEYEMIFLIISYYLLKLIADGNAYKFFFIGRYLSCLMANIIIQRWEKFRYICLLCGYCEKLFSYVTVEDVYV